MDVEIIRDDGTDIEVRLNELNAFGAIFSAGSGLFHWIRDDHILCPDTVDQKQLLSGFLAHL